MNRKKKAALAAKNKTKEKEKKRGKAFTSTFLVVLAAATVMLSGMKDAPPGEQEKLPNTPPSVEYVVDLDDFDLSPEDPNEEKKEKRTRSKWWSLLSVPLGALGHLIWLLLSPILGKILGIVLIALLFFGILCLILKTLYPDVPLKELLTPRNILTWICSTAVFVLALKVPELMKMDLDDHGKFAFIAAAVCALMMALICTEPKEKTPAS